MRWFIVRAFMHNQLRGKRWDAFHSPYLFRLFSFMRNDHFRLEKFNKIEEQRKNWLRDNSNISRTDFGMGSTHMVKSSAGTVNEIASHALSLPFQCRCMARLVYQEQPLTILELGTSLGISTAYLQTGNTQSKVTTVEGDPEIARLAQITFDKLEMKAISLVNERFDFFLEKEKPIHFDLLFVDGHHQSTALLRYYEMLKHRFSFNTILVVDDIYWSPDMYEGWKKLMDMPEVTQSVDCFQFGVLFFRKEFLEKEHHILQLPIKALSRN